MNINVELESVLNSIDDFFKDEMKSIAKLNNFDGSLFEMHQYWVNKITFDRNPVPGIYIFRIKSEKGIKVGKFDDTQYAPKLNMKNHTILQIVETSDFIDGQILYLGKSEDNIWERLSEHINGPTSPKTYALRLNDPNRSQLINNVEVFIFELKKQYWKYSSTILSSIESMLHDKLHPRVGSKR